MAMVCPTQLFYNTPDNDPLFQSSAVNWLCMDTVRDGVGAGWNLGSGWIVRRDAVDEIGGFPTNCLVEDIYSSMLMLANGWKTAYLRKALQYGLVPETYLGHVKQFTRWVSLPDKKKGKKNTNKYTQYIGGCQMATNFRFYFFPSLTKRMPTAVRGLGLSNGTFVHIRAQLTTLSLILTPLAFFTSTPLMYTSSSEQFTLLLRIHCLIIIFRFLHDLHRGVMAGCRTVLLDSASARWMAPYFTVAWLRSFILPERLGGRVEGFTATGSIANKMNERDKDRRAPLGKRLRYLVVDCGVWVHIAVVAFFLVGRG